MADEVATEEEGDPACHAVEPGIAVAQEFGSAMSFRRYVSSAPGSTMEKKLLEVERVYGSNGIAAHRASEHLATLMADTERWPAWQGVLLATCDDPSVAEVSSHLLAVARRPPCAESDAIPGADA